MGIELARAAARRGAQVTLLLGPTGLQPPRAVRVVPFVSTQELLRAARAAHAASHVVVFAAAPSDWRPARRRRGKPPRANGDLHLELRATSDVAAALGRRRGARTHIGFALEVGGGAKRARAKMLRKRLHAIVLNSKANFGPGGGRASWLSADAAGSEALPTESKPALARAIVEATRALHAHRKEGARD